MPVTNTQNIDYNIAMGASSVPRASEAFVTLTTEEKRKEMELPTPTFTPLDLDIGAMMDTEKVHIPAEPTPEQITIIVTPPDSDTEDQSLMVLYHQALTPNPKVRTSLLQVPKDRKRRPAKRASTRPPSIKNRTRTRSPSIKERNRITKAKRVFLKIQRKTVPSNARLTFSASQILRENANLAVATTKTNTRRPTPNPSQVPMHSTLYDVPLHSQIQTSHPRASVTITAKQPRWSSYFSPVTLPRPFSIFSTFNYNFQSPPQDLIPNTPPAPLGGRIVSWSSDSRRSIDLANERLPADRLSLDRPRPKTRAKEGRSCWENIKMGMGRGVLDLRKYWDGSTAEKNVSAYCEC